MLLINSKPIDYFVFPGGEIQVKLENNFMLERFILTWKPIDSSELTLLALTVNALKNMGIHDIDLDILYLPYARQDRICCPGEANSLEVICEFLDNLQLTTIRIFDVHNQKKTSELFDETPVFFIEASHIFDRYKILDEFDLSNLILCAPDLGARSRVLNLCNDFELRKPLEFTKKRCPVTGLINTIKLDEYSHNFDIYNILIVDDLCDGGSTFNQCAQVLREHGAANLYLYVTHGIFSKGLDLLQKNFRHIYCHHVLHDDHYQSTKNLTILREYPYAP